MSEAETTLFPPPGAPPTPQRDTWEPLSNILGVFINSCNDLALNLKKGLDECKEEEIREQEEKKKLEAEQAVALQVAGKASPKDEPYSAQKTQKLGKLKDDLLAAQANLSSIQEQVRQLERLYEDYQNPNTSNGRVNPAVLYKEIMKPQVVPYISNSSQMSQTATGTFQCAQTCGLKYPKGGPRAPVYNEDKMAYFARSPNGKR